MDTDFILFVLRPDSGSENREFMPGYATREDAAVRVRFDEPVAFAVDDRLVGHHRAGDQFLQCSYRVLRVTEEAGDPRYELEAEDEPLVNESRGSERVPMIYEGLVARFGDEEDCIVVDISNEGIALISGRFCPVGHTKRLSMWINEDQYRGNVTVRSAQSARRGRFRFGLTCVDDQGEDNLKASLQPLCVAMQLKYLDLLGV